MKCILKYKNYLLTNESGIKDYAGVLPYSKNQKTFLLNLRSLFVNNPLLYSSWGGKIEEYESPEECARREFFEEVGMNMDIDLKLIHIYNKQKSNGVKKYYLYIGYLDDEFVPLLTNESSGYNWITYDNLYDFPKNKLHPVFYKSINSINLKKYI